MRAHELRQMGLLSLEQQKAMTNLKHELHSPEHNVVLPELCLGMYLSTFMCIIPTYLYPKLFYK